MKKTEFQALWERNQLVLYLCKLYPCWLEPIAGTYEGINPHPDYRCVIITPAAIMSWEIAPEHMRYFDCVERRDEQTGQLLKQTPSEQYHLLREMPQQWLPEEKEGEADINQMNLL